jgi:hypothetical protein
MTYQRWMQEVDEICLGEYLTSIFDLPDMEFLDAYHSGQSPEQFMAETIPDLRALGALVLS